MKKWLLVTTTDPEWTRLYHEDDIEFIANKRSNKKDLVLVYQQSPHNKFSFIFQVKESKYQKKNQYKTVLHEKIEIPSPVDLSELKEKKVFLTGKTKFYPGFYELNEGEFFSIVNFIVKKNKGIFKQKKQTPCLGPNPKGYPIHLKEELLDFISNLNYNKIERFNEEETKYLIILPILRRLGWNTWDLRKVFPEHPADGKKVDYAFRDYNDNEIFVEAKKVSEDLKIHTDQIKRYCIRQGLTNGALTNGINWILYDIHYWEYGKGLVQKVDYKYINLLNNPEKGVNELINFFWQQETSKKGSLPQRPDFNSIIKRIQNINHHTYKCFNESAVKQNLVLPLLCSLGWDIKNSKEFTFNPLIKYRKTKFQPDYLLTGHNSIAMEIKKMGDDLENDNFGYLKNFTTLSKSDIGVLTDGKKWIFILTKGKTFYGMYEHDINSSNLNETRELFKKILSKDSTNKSVQELEKLI